MRVIVLRDVIKKYGYFTALKGVSLEVDAGEKLAILGPNGAGKTTLVKLISGQTRPTKGDVLVLNMKAWKFNAELRRKIGFVSHNPMLYDELTAYENLRFYGRLYDVKDLEKRIEEILKQVKLYERRHARVKTFSRGMKQRLSIARALLHDPEILILDEPTSGLDVEGRRELIAYLKRYGEGRTILLTTHDISEAVSLCDRAVILLDGKIVEDCRASEAEERYMRVVGLEGN
ncbi:heme ABC exporter ATP-binding protein CcmA [Archaeoglobus veneficus]|uniref:Sulfate-transporting ATPase n=1 Tax=Archaeoglobus veneficus (strain DSM 11195 / SNP6) TaxID=693661 RepID=F2KNH5_ARCVS|nr:heme ABC exporter ATP-binding protein CcmA [Archaeoglobus veneficus]AEA47377.1 Sulfate-transporting ATPase [Archaeoglobus veneficus SNP6]